jgi:hypothetical protein
LKSSYFDYLFPLGPLYDPFYSTFGYDYYGYLKSFLWLFLSVEADLRLKPVPSYFLLETERELETDLDADIDLERDRDRPPATFL